MAERPLDNNRNPVHEGAYWYGRNIVYVFQNDNPGWNNWLMDKYIGRGIMLRGQVTQEKARKLRPVNRGLIEFIVLRKYHGKKELANLKFLGEELFNTFAF